MIEAALQPDWSYSQYEAASVVYELHRAEAEIAKLVGSDPARAVALYETLLEACDVTVEEVDDSDGEFGTFAGSLYLGWIRARQAASADSAETTRLLLKFMDDDSYGFCNDLAPSAVKVLDRDGLESFEREVRARFDHACVDGDERKRRKKPNLNFYIDRWADMLRAIYSHRRDVGKYIDLTGRAGLTKVDCHTIATIFQTKHKPNDALAWVERGLGIEKRGAFDAVGHQLGEMRRVLLVKLGRGGEALDSAWAEYRKHPGRFTYEVLVRYVPKTQRVAWHEKAMEVSEQGDLDSLIELWLAAKEIGRLAARLDLTSDSELERLSHYVTEPAAERLAKSHPGVAAKVFRALCMRIVDEGKSQYYFAALSSLGKAKNCYQRAGLDAQWQAVIAEIRRKHHRKSGFMPGFERIAGGAQPRKKARRVRAVSRKL
jgi:hypothetical protein